MERIIEVAVSFSAVLVPILALWAVVGLYALRTGVECYATQLLFFCSLMFIAGMTVRTIMANDGLWLVHTASLGVMVVAGVMKRPMDHDGALLSGSP